jgi:uncharacterized protein GlcG (DUF336 family)
VTNLFFRIRWAELLIRKAVTMLDQLEPIRAVGHITYIAADGGVEGAIGVAGGLTDERDEECARAALTSRVKVREDDTLPDNVTL